MSDLTPVHDSDFQDKVLSAGKPVLVDFWAPWCQPCRIVQPIVAEIASERDDIEVYSLNIDDNPQVAGSLNIMSIPTLVLFRDGQEAMRNVGSQPKRSIASQIDAVLGA